MVKTDIISLNTKGHCDLIDITPDVEHQLVESSIENGIVTVFVTGSTAGLTTIEYEPGLISDLKEIWQRIVPENIPYAHDRAWGDGNGHAHVRSALIGVSLVIPFNRKKLSLGTWQQVILLDFDNRPRSRKLMVQIMGE
jgi:secondary thiamine-phosphate synthase enzyme